MSERGRPSEEIFWLYWSVVSILVALLLWSPLCRGGRGVLSDREMVFLAAGILVVMVAGMLLYDQQQKDKD